MNHLRRRLQQLETRARERELADQSVSNSRERLMRRVEQIRSRMPPEQLLAYQSQPYRDAMHVELRARLQMFPSRVEGDSQPSAAEVLLRKLVDLTVPSPRAISVCDPRGHHDAIGNQIHPPSLSSNDRISCRRLAGDLGILDQASAIVPGNGCESQSDDAERSYWTK